MVSRIYLAESKSQASAGKELVYKFFMRKHKKNCRNIIKADQEENRFLLMKNMKMI